MGEVSACTQTECQTQQTQPFGTLRRRTRYIVRFAYYLAVHRSISSAHWVLAAEGIEWN